MARVPFELKGKTVFVAGHGGMVGAALVRRLAREDVELVTIRRAEVDLLVGDASKAREKLGWTPKTSFAQLVKEMVAGDLADARREVANGKPSV